MIELSSQGEIAKIEPYDQERCQLWENGVDQIIKFDDFVLLEVFSSSFGLTTWK